jgi:Luciferase-like monooxygenase
VSETFDALRRLLAGKEVTEPAHPHRFDAIELAFPPAVPPELWIGAVGERALRLAGAKADGVLLSVLSSPDYVQWARDLVAQGATEVGRPARRSLCSHWPRSRSGQRPPAMPSGRRSVSFSKRRRTAHSWGDPHVRVRYGSRSLPVARSPHATPGLTNSRSRVPRTRQRPGCGGCTTRAPTRSVYGCFR